MFIFFNLIKITFNLLTLGLFQETCFFNLLKYMYPKGALFVSNEKLDNRWSFKKIQPEDKDSFLIPSYFYTQKVIA